MHAAPPCIAESGATTGQDPADKIIAFPAAVCEDGEWFAVLTFELRGEPFGDDFVLWAVPCSSAEHATEIAEAFLEFAGRRGSDS